MMILRSNTPQQLENAVTYYEILLEAGNQRQFEQIASAYPGMFRTVIPAYIVTDLIFALVFAFLFVTVGSALGGCAKAGVTLGVIITILSPVIGNLYEYYGVTYLPAG